MDHQQRNSSSKSSSSLVDMRGLELRKGREKESIRIVFTYKGILCKETLKLEHTPRNLRYAGRLRGEILNEIERGTFQYFEYFPNSKKAKQFGKIPTRLTIGDLLRTHLAAVEKSESPSTYRGYKQVSDSHLFKKWDSTVVTELNRLELKNWIHSLTCKEKTIRNILTPLRNVVKEAMNDGLIDTNPFDSLVINKLLSREQKQSDFVVDPFSINEIYAILDACSSDQERNLWKTFFATGARTSELIALKWDYINFANSKILIRERRVESITEKVLKTAAGKRDIDMRKAAFEAITDQMKYTKAAGKEVFIDDRLDTRWGNDHILRMRFKRILKKADVRYRNPYQTRHTFASTLLSSGGNPLYVASQMGHAGLEMIQKRYGRWIDQGTSNGTLTKLDAFFAPVLPQDIQEQ